MLLDSDRFLGDLDMLNYARGLIPFVENAAAIRTSVEAVLVGLVDLLLRKGRTLMSGMARLPTDLSLFPMLGLGGFGRLDDITGWRLRQGGRILASLGQLGLQFGDALVLGGCGNVGLSIQG